MKNITSYNDFKNQKYNNKEVINERGGTGMDGKEYTISSNDPFVNVAGNFAGCDQTLVGSAVIKLFMFVRRKGYQALMKTWLKPALYSAYMKGLLKYTLSVNKPLPKAKESYTINKVAELSDKKRLPQLGEDLIVKFDLNGQNVFGLNAKVIKVSGNTNVEDCYYQVKDGSRIFQCKGGLVTEEDSDLVDDNQDQTTTISRVADEKNAKLPTPEPEMEVKFVLAGNIVDAQTGSTVSGITSTPIPDGYYEIKSDNSIIQIQNSIVIVSNPNKNIKIQRIAESTKKKLANPEVEIEVKFQFNGSDIPNPVTGATVSGNTTIPDGYYQINGNKPYFKCKSTYVIEINSDITSNDDLVDMYEDLVNNGNKLTEDEIGQTLTIVAQYLYNLCPSLKEINDKISSGGLSLYQQYRYENDKEDYERVIEQLWSIWWLASKLYKQKQPSETWTKDTVNGDSDVANSSTKHLHPPVPTRVNDSVKYDMDKNYLITEELSVGKDPGVSEQVKKLKLQGVDLENDEVFNQQFIDPTVKNNATKVALDYRSEIIKIQLAAERFYITNEKSVDRKLQNSWLKMVQNVKTHFTSYFNIEELDPQYLRNKLGEDPKNVGGNPNGIGSGILSDAGDVKIMDGFEKNDILNKILKRCDTLGDFNAGQLGIIKINGQFYIVGTEALSTCRAYTIIAHIPEPEKLEKVKSENDIKDFVKSEGSNYPLPIKPKTMNFPGSSTNTSNYITTYLLYPSKDAPSVSKDPNGLTQVPNKLFVMYLYSTQTRSEYFNSKDVLKNECIFNIFNKNANADVSLENISSPDNFKIVINFGLSYQIKQGHEDLFLNSIKRNLKLNIDKIFSPKNTTNGGFGGMLSKIGITLK